MSFKRLPRQPENNTNKPTFYPDRDSLLDHFLQPELPSKDLYPHRLSTEESTESNVIGNYFGTLSVAASNLPSNLTSQKNTIDKQDRKSQNRNGGARYEHYGQESFPLRNSVPAISPPASSYEPSKFATVQHDRLYDNTGLDSSIPDA